MDENRRRRGLLVGQGDIGLVMFHLARRGYEFVLATGHSPIGDIWAHIGGQKIGIEVKTTMKGNEWFVPRKQISQVDFYCLVAMRSGDCYVLKASEIADLANRAVDIHPGVARITVKGLPVDAREGWHRLTEAVAPAINPLPQRVNKPHIVRKTLSDGRVREYSYPARVSKSGRAGSLIPHLDSFWYSK